MWIICQIGAREHYAVARALHQEGLLDSMITDFWVRPDSVFGVVPVGRRLRDRYHSELQDANVKFANGRILGFEIWQRLVGLSGWEAILERNRIFQKFASGVVSTCGMPDDGSIFCYSYAALGLFRQAKQAGWRTVLGQIDPGPEEERIVMEEHERYSHLTSAWQPAPAAYWDRWREEVELADRIVVNSEWSRQCICKEGVAKKKLEVVPLVYEENAKGVAGGGSAPRLSQRRHRRVFRVLFLGQINLRKGVGRLLDAMHLLRDESIELILAGPSEIPVSAWQGNPSVHWVGPVPRSQVGRYYDDADVFILPTLSDGYALTQLEALSHGLPVISSRNCGEAVTDGVNGIVLEDLEPETIAAGIQRASETEFSDVRPPTFGLVELAERLNSLIK